MSSAEARHTSVCVRRPAGFLPICRSHPTNMPSTVETSTTNSTVAGQPGEQATMFFLDPAGNALEFKAMADPAKLFATS